MGFFEFLGWLIAVGVGLILLAVTLCFGLVVAIPLFLIFAPGLLIAVIVYLCMKGDKK